MAAPAPTPRAVPLGVFLANGYQALVTFAVDPAIELWEKVVTPPGISYGEKIDITTQHNREVRTATARKLAEVKDAKFTCAYDPEVYNLIGVTFGTETTVTYTFPDTSTLAFYGYLADFEPESMEEGKQPEATITIHVTNRDPTLPFHANRRRNQFPAGEFGAGTGTAYLVNEFTPAWAGPDPVLLAKALKAKLSETVTPKSRPPAGWNEDRERQLAQMRAQAATLGKK